MRTITARRWRGWWRRGGEDLGSLDPHDVPGFVALMVKVEQVQGHEARLAAVLAEHGIRDMEHWRHVVMAMGARHGGDPEFQRACLQRKM
jgi:hypothetical protein